MKIKLQIKHRLTGTLLFEYEKEDNTIKETLLEAIKAGANLCGADLRCADLRCADLRYANLSGANLYDAYLRGADLSDANLRDAYLRDANLRDAYLRGADLRYANLCDANLRGADLRGAKNSDYAIAITRTCPEGDIIGWKKCQNDIIVKLLIPKEAKRNNAFGRKCRAEFADVLEIFGAEKAYSNHDSSFVYEVGKRIIPNHPFEDDFTQECASGIHFFITRLEAEKYF